MFNLKLFYPDSTKTLVQNLRGTNLRSPRSIRSFLGKRGLKLKFETRNRWAILFNGEVAGFMKRVQ